MFRMFYLLNFDKNCTFQMSLCKVKNGFILEEKKGYEYISNK